MKIKTKNGRVEKPGAFQKSNYNNGLKGFVKYSIERVWHRK